MLIGITGGSGSGKSTATKMLNDKLENSMIIQVDEIMYEATALHERLLFGYLKVEKKKYWEKAICDSFENLEKWYDVVGSTIESKIVQTIYANKGIDYFLIDWSMLPLTSFYDMLDISIFTICDFDTRKERLKERIRKNMERDNWDEEGLNNRLTISALNERGYTSTHQLDTNGSLEELEKQVDVILKDIRKVKEKVDDM